MESFDELQELGNDLYNAESFFVPCWTQDARELGDQSECPNPDVPFCYKVQPEYFDHSGSSVDIVEITEIDQPSSSKNPIWDIPSSSQHASMPPPTNKTSTSTKAEREGPKTCAVCGDTATGYHYEVASCNGCKTFFRRTVLEQRIFECKNENKCFDKLPQKKKRVCRACRFVKCVEKGMNPLAIQTDQDPSKNEMLKSIVAKRKAEEDDGSSSENCLAVKLNPEIELRVREQEIDRLIDGLMYLEIKSDTLRKSTYNPSDFHMKLEDLINTHSAFSMADKLQPMPDWPLPPVSRFHRMRQRKIEWNRKHWLFFDIIVSVEYAKTFPFYSRLCDADKILLLRHVSLMCGHITEAFFSYEAKSDTYVHPDGTIPILLTHAVTPHHKRIYNDSMQPLIRLKLDKKEYVLLKAVILCNSAISGLTPHATKLIERERENYSKSLFSYIMAAHGAANGPSRFQAILNLVSTFINTAQAQRDFHILLMMWRGKKHGIVLVDQVMSV